MGKKWEIIVKEQSKYLSSHWVTFPGGNWVIIINVFFANNLPFRGATIA